MDGRERRRSARRRTLHCERLEGRELLAVAPAGAPAGIRTLRSERSAYAETVLHDLRGAEKSPEFRQQTRELQHLSLAFFVDLRPVLAHSHATEREAAALNRDERLTIQPRALMHSIRSARDPLQSGEQVRDALMTMEGDLFLAELTGSFTDRQWANSLEQQAVREDLARVGAPQDATDQTLADLRRFAVSIGASPSERSKLIMDTVRYYDVLRTVFESTGLTMMNTPVEDAGATFGLFVRRRS